MKKTFQTNMYELCPELKLGVNKNVFTIIRGGSIKMLRGPDSRPHPYSGCACPCPMDELNWNRIGTDVTNAIKYK